MQELDTSSSRQSLFVRLSVYFLIVCLVLYAGRTTIADTDLWGHVKFGLDSLAGGQLLHTDPYSYLTADHAWINHEWLAEIVMALVYRLGGAAGLSIMRLLFVAVLFSMFLFCFARNRVPMIAGAPLIALAAYIMYGLSLQLYPVRPQLFTYLFFAVELIVLHHCERRQKLSSLWILPPLFCLWINFHGGVLAGLAVFCAFCGCALMRCALRRKWQRADALLIVLPLLSILLCGITPYGFELLAFLVKEGTVPRPDIVEWHPIHLFTGKGLACLALCILAGWLFDWRMARTEPIICVIVAACLFAAFKAERHLPLATIAVLLLCAPALGDYLRKFPRLQVWSQVHSRAVAMLLFGAGCFFLYETLSVAPYLVDVLPMPSGAISVLKRAGVKGNLACWFDWGEYCIWHLYPQIKVSVDGRRETTYSPAKYMENYNFGYGAGRWDKILTDEPTDFVLTNTWFNNYDLMQARKGWKMVYGDSVCALFVREGSPYIARIQALTPPFQSPSIFP